jgi:hypothetical protein
MTRVPVAMAEIVREGTWALRALGYPYGTAERAAPLLAWTEAVQGNGLTMLRLGEAAISESAARPPAIWRRDAQGTWLAEAHGKCLLECGAPAIDLATADARTGAGVGRAVLRGAIGTRLSAALAALAARRGLAAVLVHSPDAAEIAPVPTAGWICALPTSLGPAFLNGGLDEPLPDVLPEALRIAADDIAAARKNGADGFFSVAAVASPPFAPPSGAVDWPERLARAYRTGSAADRADYEYLYELEIRTWAPTSERSRAQAGFGRY